MGGSEEPPELSESELLVHGLSESSSSALGGGSALSAGDSVRTAWPSPVGTIQVSSANIPAANTEVVIALPHSSKTGFDRSSRWKDSKYTEKVCENSLVSVEVEVIIPSNLYQKNFNRVQDWRKILSKGMDWMDDRSGVGSNHGNFSEIEINRTRPFEHTLSWPCPAHKMW